MSKTKTTDDRIYAAIQGLKQSLEYVVDGCDDYVRACTDWESQEDLKLILAKKYEELEEKAHELLILIAQCHLLNAPKHEEDE